MLPRIAVGIAVGGISLGLLLGGSSSAQTIHPPAGPSALLVLVKHDGDHHDNGRKLGHFKRHGDDDEDDDGRRALQRARPSMLPPYMQAPVTGPYGMPGYGSSYGTSPYGYPGPSYYRGY